MTSTRKRLHLLLWPAGAALGLAAEAVAFDWSDPTRWIPDLAVGWTFIACGLLTTARRLDTRTGALMTATGFTWFFGNFTEVDVGFISWLAAQAIYLHRGPLVHVIVAYPRGRATSTSGRAAVGVGYTAAVITPVWENDAAILVLCASLVAVTSYGYFKAVGRDRRARLFSVGAAAALGAVLAGGAAARLAFDPGDVAFLTLFAYEIVLVGIAGLLFAGLVWASRERSDVTDLVIELGEVRSGTLRGALSRALGDPSLDVGYWIEDINAFVDSDGRAIRLPDPGADRTVTVIDRDGQPLAAIVHDVAVLDDPKLVDAVSSAARLAAENARLQAEVQARVVELSESRRRILDARDEERVRLERRLREGAHARLEQIAQTLQRAEASSSTESTKERIVHAETQLERALDELRRLGSGLHPRVLSEEGLAGALEALTEGSPVHVESDVTTNRMEPSVEAAAYFVCAEALANISKHASASMVRISVATEDSRVVVRVEDDGVGGAEPNRRGSGLRGLADRVEAVGGKLHVDSWEGRGTRITAEIPLSGERY